MIIRVRNQCRRVRLCFVRPVFRYFLCSALGLAIGVSIAVLQVRGGISGGTITNGPWTTARTYGTAGASALVRAQVALGGLLALPAKEAMYFNASVDSAGAPLEGRCAYKVEGFVFKNGGAIDARWWSITLYNQAGYLVVNPQRRHSIGSGSIGPVTLAPTSKWSFTVAPKAPSDAKWISTGGIARFDLTLRVYHPGPAVLATPDKVTLPTITKMGCA